MLGFNRWHLFKGLAVILCIVGMSWLALDYFVPAPPSKLTIATGAKNQTYEAIGKRYREILARSHVDVELRLTNGAVENVKLLNDPTSGIKIGIAQGGISDSDRSPDLLSLGRINYQIYWIFHRATETLDDLRQLKGKRIAVGPQGSGQRVTTEKILAISGVNSENTTLLNLSTQDAENALNDGQIDALFLPIALDAPILQSLLKNPRLRAMSFTEAEAVTRIFPFLVRLVLPRAVIDFERIVPAADMILIATPNVVLVRKDIHPALIDLLAQAIVEVHGRPGIFQQAGEFPTLTDPEYPLAHSARDFYKNGPSFLNRYLPFWMTSYAQRIIAVLVAVIAIVLPVFSYAPKLYRWFLQDRMRRLYRRLRIVEEAAQTQLTAPQVVSLQTELEDIDCAARILPQRHAYFIPARPSTIAIAMSFKGSSYERFALGYRETLSRSHLTLNLHPTDGPLDNLRLIKDQSSGVDVALLFGGLTNSEQSPGLISLGRIAFAPIWIFYRGTETLERLTQLKGKRIAVPAATRVVLEQILAAHGVNSDNTTMSPLASPAAAKAFKDGEVDVFVLIIELNAPLVQALLRDPTVRLMSVTQAEALARVYPFLTRLVLPQGVIDFERNIPTNDVSLIADTQAVLVRKNLHPELIYLLAQALSEEHGRAGIFQRAGDFPTVTDPEFPVAQDALDFYKNGPSFLDRYLPFWMTSYAKRTIAVLLTVIAIVLPVFSYAPKLYLWFVRDKMSKLYRRLRIVDKALLTELTAAGVQSLQTDLDNIDRAASIVPMRNSDLFFDLRTHIDRTRAHLAARLIEARSQTARVA